ncbi:MAG: aminotransferase class V-fold PLP-dependent enzyme [Acidobacteriota bacterium]
MSLQRGWKEHFRLGDRVYLNGANHGPFPAVAIEAVQEALAWKRDPSLVDDAVYFDLPERVRRAAAPFFGCEPHEIAVVTGASTGINLVVSGLDWRRGDQVVIPGGEFPANYLPWYSLRARGIEVTIVESGDGLTVEDIAAALRPTTRVVAVGHVNFATGYQLDINAIGELCADRGIVYVVDASQSLGAVPLDARRCRATVVTSAGYKWLCSPYGTGLFYVQPEWVERLAAPIVNWEAVVGAEDFNKLTDLRLDYRTGARRYDAPETASFLNGMPMAASLEFLGEIGPQRIFDYVGGLLDRLIRDLPESFRTDSAVEPRCRSTILRLVAADPGRTRAAYDRCLATGITVSLRESGIRVSPGVWNAPEDIDHLLDVLAAA